MQGISLENVFIVRVSNLPKSGKNRQRYKNPISLYYLSVSMGVVKNEYTPIWLYECRFLIKLAKT